MLNVVSFAFVESLYLHLLVVSVELKASGLMHLEELAQSVDALDVADLIAEHLAASGVFQHDPDDGKPEPNIPGPQ